MEPVYDTMVGDATSSRFRAASSGSVLDLEGDGVDAGDGVRVEREEREENDEVDVFSDDEDTTRPRAAREQRPRDEEENRPRLGGMLRRGRMGMGDGWKDAPFMEEDGQIFEGSLVGANGWQRTRVDGDRHRKEGRDRQEDEQKEGRQEGEQRVAAASGIAQEQTNKPFPVHTAATQK